MEPITPDPKLFQLPEGTREIVYAKDQPEYLPLPVLKTPDGRVSHCWKLTPGDLALVNECGFITITQHTFNWPLQPVSVNVGGKDLRW